MGNQGENWRRNLDSEMASAFKPKLKICFWNMYKRDRASMEFCPKIFWGLRVLGPRPFRSQGEIIRDDPARRRRFCRHAKLDSSTEDENSHLAQEGFVVVKLFNLLARELGPIFLEGGVLSPKNDFGDFLRSFPYESWKGCRETKLDGEEKDEIQLETLNGMNQAKWLLLSVHFSL